MASSLKNQLSSILNASIPGFDEEEIYLAYFGFETQQDGSFVVNQDTFTDYFEANPAHFSAFFNSRVSTNSALISASMIGAVRTKLMPLQRRARQQTRMQLKP